MVHIYYVINSRDGLGNRLRLVYPDGKVYYIATQEYLPNWCIRECLNEESRLERHLKHPELSRYWKKSCYAIWHSNSWMYTTRAEAIIAMRNYDRNLGLIAFYIGDL